MNIINTLDKQHGQFQKAMAVAAILSKYSVLATRTRSMSITLSGSGSTLFQQSMVRTTL